MRSLHLFLSLFCLLALVACGSEEELTAPAFSSITASGALDSTTILSAPSQDPTVTISGNIDDFTATIVANSTVTGEVSVAVDSSNGSWNFPFDPQEGVNSLSFTASDVRGNLNQMILTVTHDTTAPLVTAVTPGTDPLIPQLIVTFNEALSETSLASALFAVDGVALTAAPFDSLTPSTVILPLSESLPIGSHRLTCSGFSDISTPTGNSVAVGYFFDFTIE